MAIIDFLPVTYQGEAIRERWPFPLPAHLKSIADSHMTPVLLGVELMARFTQLQEQQLAREDAGVSFQEDILTHYPFNAEGQGQSGSPSSSPQQCGGSRLRSLEALNR